MSIRLITFDLDDTLWDVAPVMNNAERELRQWLSQHAPDLGPVPVEHLWVFRKRLLSADPSLKYRLSELRRRILFHALQEAGYAMAEANDLAEGGFQVFLAARHKVTFFDGVHSTLQQLSQHYSLGVITNGNADVARLGLADYFQFALSAEGLGVGKPEALPFQEALRRSGVSAEQALHIGDHPGDDIAGARQAGWHAVWYNPQHKAWTGEHAPSAQVQQLQELPPLLAQWPRHP